jgi:hypothetical protein
VAVWDRYLAYGDALGMTRVCAAVIDLGLGDRRNVWSSHGGTWHRVRVRYPLATGTYGATVPRVLGGALATGALGALLLWVLASAARFAEETAETALRRGVDAAQEPVGVVAVLLLVRGGYRLVRGAVDGLTPAHLHGEVLWLTPARTESTDDETVVVVYHLAVDDGTAPPRGRCPVPWQERAGPGTSSTSRSAAGRAACWRSRS